MSKDGNIVEWNENKRRAVLKDRGLDFAEVAKIFDGRPEISVPSNRQDEERWKTTSVLNNEMITAVWTYRGKNIRRIITVRRARNYEERKYYESIFGRYNPRKNQGSNGLGKGPP